MLSVKILGPGCRNCEKLESITREALAKMGADASVEKVADYGEILQYNVISTPGLVINERVVSSGRIPSEAEVTTWIVDAMATA